MQKAAHSLPEFRLMGSVLQELVGDKSLERFRVEYEKLFRTLKKSHGAHACAYTHLHPHTFMPTLLKFELAMNTMQCTMVL
eukprot:scaffold85448_cov17-Tisochrysis_lutea.AAC.3